MEKFAWLKFLSNDSPCWGTKLVSSFFPPVAARFLATPENSLRNFPDLRRKYYQKHYWISEPACQLPRNISVFIILKKLNAALDRPRGLLENVAMNSVPLKSLRNLPDLSMAAMLLLRLVKLVRPWPCDTTNWKAVWRNPRNRLHWKLYCLLYNSPKAALLLERTDCICFPLLSTLWGVGWSTCELEAD